MLKHELINSASEEKSNGNEESKTSNEYLSDFTKLQLHMYEPRCVSNGSVKENCAGKK